MSDEQYIENKFGKLYMNKDNIVSSHLASHFKVSAKENPFTDKEKKDMVRVPYCSTMESLMEIMVSTMVDVVRQLIP